MPLISFGEHLLPVFGVLLAYFIPTPSGRYRYNVSGCINAITHDLITVCNTSYINALSVVKLLEKVYEKHINSMVPVTIFLDNAKYQHCKLVISRAKELGIELMFLPSYSPNLNLIERLWKWIKKDCLNCKYYDEFGKFKDAINSSLRNIECKQVKNEINSLLSLKFQSFENSYYNRA